MELNTEQTFLQNYMFGPGKSFVHAPHARAEAIPLLARGHVLFASAQAWHEVGIGPCIIGAPAEDHWARHGCHLLLIGSRSFLDRCLVYILFLHAGRRGECAGRGGSALL